MRATKQKPATTERRHSPRRQPTLGTTCRLMSQAGKSLGVGLVWNISASGVSMFVGTKLDPGTELKGELFASETRDALALTLRVAHLAKLLTGDYFIGGQFERPLTEQELRPFVV